LDHYNIALRFQGRKYNKILPKGLKNLRKKNPIRTISRKPSAANQSVPLQPAVIRPMNLKLKRRKHHFNNLYMIFGS